MDLSIMTGMPDLLVAWLPILLPLLFLVVLRMSARKGMTISAIIVVIFGVIHWGMDETIITATVLKGIWQTVTILLILLGAMTLLNTLKNTGAVKRINEGFGNLSRDMRVQAILLGFLFVSLLEGAAGFGSPAAVVGPLLLLLGFKPIAAASIALLGDTVAVSFGAVNTPISVGLGGVMESIGIAEKSVVQAVVFMDLFIATFVPMIIVFVLTQLFTNKKERNMKDFVEFIPWTLLIGATYALTAYGLGMGLGKGEFISIFSSVITMIVAVITVKLGFLIPKTEWRKASSVQTAASKKAAEKVVGKAPKTKKAEGSMSLITAWSPYLVVIGLLMLTRLVPSDAQQQIKDFFDLSYGNIMGTGIGQGFQVLWNPGTVLLTAAIVASLLQAKNFGAFNKAIKEAANQSKNTGLTLVAILIMVGVFANSGINANGLTSMPIMIADELSFFGAQYFIIAPFISSLGSFITGSATVSNLTFGGVHASAAVTAGVNPAIILAQGTSGAAIGNCYCISNVVAASTVVGETGQEGAIIAKTLPVALILSSLSVIAGAIAIALGMFA